MDRIKQRMLALQQQSKKIAKEVARGSAQFAVSAAEAPKIIRRGGQTNNRTYQAPYIGKFQSFQNEAKPVFNDVIEGKRRLAAGLRPFGQTLLNAPLPIAGAKVAENPVEIAYNVAKMKQGLRQNLRRGEAMVINPDAAKEASSWRGMANPRYHDKIFSPVADKLYDWALKNNPSPIVRRTGGGAGSGKSEMVLKNIRRDFPGIVLDKTTSTVKGFKKDYEKAKEAGKATEVYGVLANLPMARQFTKRRAEKIGREIPLSQFANSHAGFAETMHEILTKYPKVKAALLDNRAITNKKNAQENVWMINREKMIETLSQMKLTPEKIKKMIKS